MKQVTINTYTAQELKDEFPAAFERAHDEYKESVYAGGIAWGDEIMDSLKAVFKHTNGITLLDYSIDNSGGYSWLKVSFDQDEAEDLHGARAQAWLENNLLADLRIKWQSYGRIDKDNYWKSARSRLARYGSYYRPGMIKPCPFTGVCFDEDFLNSLRNDIKAGCTIGEAFENLANAAARLLSQEWENELSEEYFLEMAEGNDWTFDEDGRRL